ncbi:MULTISPECIES: alpha/beta hydrolase [Sporosarcina]|uniref:alpha/beta hydrolase n=1 Tax=Sporosarcina TaxID=1569 RepID=UPI00129B8ADF|nr:MULTISPECIES: alpha/beta fold hydrolase [Sporosarcina]GKV67206.1 carboxylesterase [Sporosarcina sp. NCCP-2331]GLB57562.1 carboxylesterase [Sporosarcina sp. NCCP-2378]
MKTGVLFIHGFTGGPFEIAPLRQYLKQHTDWEIAVPVLPGHELGRNLQEGSAASWIMAAELELQRLMKETDRVIVIGFSMGGLIAMYLSLRYPIDKLVLLSAAAKYISPRILVEDAKVVMRTSKSGCYPADSFYHLYNYKLTHTPVRAALEFLKVVRLVRPYHHDVRTPVCIVQGKRDGIVPAVTADLLYEQLGSDEKQLIYSEHGKHHICYSNDRYEWFSRVLAFLSKD